MVSFGIIRANEKKNIKIKKILTAFQLKVFAMIHIFNNMTLLVDTIWHY